MRNSFTVCYTSHGNPEMCILGVTSIVPNLNGLLLFTEDGEGFQIENCEMRCGTLSPSVRLFIEYSNDEDIAQEFSNPEVKVFDHRRHWQDPC